MNQDDQKRNGYMLKGPLIYHGYDWWWHNFTAYHRITGEEKVFFIEYYVCNPGYANDQPVLGQLPANQETKTKPSYAMVKVGTWGCDARQIHNFYPISAFSGNEDMLKVAIGDCHLTETHMDGRVSLTEQEVMDHPEYMSDAGQMQWNLSINKKVTYNVGYGASEVFRTINAFEMFWHVQGMMTQYAGEVIYNGEVYDVIPEKSYGYADKNWGGDFTSPWLWIASSNLKSMKSGKELSNSGVLFGGGRPKVFGVSFDRKLLGCFFYEGKMYEYNFSKFWTSATTSFQFEEQGDENIWKVRAENQDSVLKLLLKCPKDEMLLINYEAPDGQKRHNRLWNGGTGYGAIKLYQKDGAKLTLIDHIEMSHAGCEYGEYDN